MNKGWGRNKKEKRKIWKHEDKIPKGRERGENDNWKQKEEFKKKVRIKSDQVTKGSVTKIINKKKKTVRDERKKRVSLSFSFFLFLEKKKTGEEKSETLWSVEVCVKEQKRKRCFFSVRKEKGGRMKRGLGFSIHALFFSFFFDCRR